MLEAKPHAALKRMHHGLIMKKVQGPCSWMLSA